MVLSKTQIKSLMVKSIRFSASKSAECVCPSLQFLKLVGAGLLDMQQLHVVFPGVKVLEVAQAVFINTEQIANGSLVKLSIADSANIDRRVLANVIQANRLTLQNVSFDRTHLPLVDIFETEPYIIENFAMTNVFIDRAEEGACFYPLSPTYLEFVYACAKLSRLVSAKITPSSYRHESKFKDVGLAVWTWAEVGRLDLAYKQMDVCFGSDERQRKCFTSWISK